MDEKLGRNKSDIEETQSKITPYSYTKSCLIASQKENSVVPTTRKNCESCISCDRPKSYNTHVSALVNLNRQERILNGEEILKLSHRKTEEIRKQL